jgi:hypothetical protein
MGIRDALEEAFSVTEAEKPELEDKVAATAADASPPSETPAATEPESKGDQSPPQGEPPADKAQAPQEGGTQKEAAPAEAPLAQKLEKAPGSWKPAAREKWASVDPTIREEIYRREAEISRGLNQSTKDASFGREINEIVAPYQHTFRAAGTDAKTAVSKLLETDAVLRYGTPIDKAQRAYEILSYYGVDVQALGALIMGEQPPQQQVDPQVAALQQRLAALESGNQSQQEQFVSSLKTELETFASDPKNEFYRDVRLDMATLLESGRAKDLQDAYDKAIWANPETRQVLLDRQAVELSKNVSKRAAAAREASSSINGSGEPVTHQVDPANLRAVIASAFDSAGDRL